MQIATIVIYLSFVILHTIASNYVYTTADPLISDAGTFYYIANNASHKLQSIEFNYLRSPGVPLIMRFILNNGVSIKTLSFIYSIFALSLPCLVGIIMYLRPVRRTGHVHLAMALSALSMLPIHYSHYYLSELPATFFLLLYVLLFIAFMAHGHAYLGLSAGLAFGFSGLFRPELVVVSIICSFFCILLARRLKVPHYYLPFIGLLFVYVPHSYRCSTQTNTACLVSHNMIGNMVIGFSNAKGVNFKDGTWIPPNRDDEPNSKVLRLDIKRTDIKAGAAWITTRILQSPLNVLKTVTKNFLDMFYSPLWPSLPNLNKYNFWLNNIIFFESTLALVGLLSCIIYFVRFRFSYPAFELTLFMIIVTYFIFHCLSLGEIRYRLVIQPLLIMHLVSCFDFAAKARNSMCLGDNKKTSLYIKLIAMIPYIFTGILLRVI
jgi:hypothetical protein